MCSMNREGFSSRLANFCVLSVRQWNEVTVITTSYIVPICRLKVPEEAPFTAVLKYAAEEVTGISLTFLQLNSIF